MSLPRGLLRRPLLLRCSDAGMREWGEGAALLRYELAEGDFAAMGMHCTILELSGNSCQVIGPVRPWSRPLLTLLI